VDLAECFYPVRGPVCGEGMHIVTEHESFRTSTFSS